MACSIEMQFCERCGREVPLYFIRLVRNEDGEAQYACEECLQKAKDEAEAVEPLPVPAQVTCD